MVNSINWIDGLDGLAAAVCLISSLGLTIVATLKGDFHIAVWLISIIGASIGFLFYNWAPAKIFLGDCGSYLLGFSIAAANIMQFYSLNSITNFNSEFQSLIPIFIVLIPIFDMIIVIKRRLTSGLSPFYPDTTHIHHRLLNSGMNYKNSIFFILSFSILFTVIGVGLALV